MTRFFGASCCAPSASCRESHSPLFVDETWRADVANAVVRFKVNVGAGGNVETYDLILSVDGAPRVERRNHADQTAEPRVTVSLDGTDLVLLGAGKLDSVTAALERRITLEGDLQFMSVVSALLAGDKFPAQQALS